MAGIVDNTAHRVGYHPLRQAGPEHGQDLGEVRDGVEPSGDILFLKDHQHPIMNGLHQFVGRGGDDGHGLDDPSLLPFPTVPYPGLGKDLIRRRSHEIGLFACTLAAPLKRTHLPGRYSDDGAQARGRRAWSRPPRPEH